MKLLKNSKSKPGVMVDKGNHNTQKAEAGRIPKVYGSSAFHTQSDTLSKKKQFQKCSLKFQNKSTTSTYEFNYRNLRFLT